MQEETPRNLQERTGRHVCTHCLTLVSAEEFFRNDHLCDRCAALDEGAVAADPDAADAAGNEARDEKR
jgi:hypothetical protein